MQRWDIFCKVIDNYGDVGVCWRLARQLSAEYGLEVRLWLDELDALAAIWPTMDANQSEQMVAGVNVRHWHEQVDWHNEISAHVVIEGFACHIPHEYIADMIEQKNYTGNQPVWLNLEYLSAEDWVQECHLMNSPQRGGLNKVFFFPGFSANTGGLLRERHLPLSVTADEVKEHDCYGDTNDRLKISLFGYDSMPIKPWLESLFNMEQTKVTIAVTHGKAAVAMRQAWTELGLKSNEVANLRLNYLPMLDQLAYDDLLHCSDFNFVRGEDSLVRSLWAQKPMTWHIYPQEDNAHLVKLDAFSNQYIQYSGVPEWFAQWQKAWNTGDAQAVQTLWPSLVKHIDQFKQGTQRYAQHLLQNQDLAQQLVALVERISLNQL